MGSFHQLLVQYIPALNNSIFNIPNVDPLVADTINKTISNINPEYLTSTVVNVHPIVSVLLFLLVVLILGEVLFLRDIKKNKIEYQLKDDIDTEIKNRKIKAFFLSFVSTLVLPYFLFFLLLICVIFALMIYCVVFNIIAVIVQVLEVIVLLGIGYFVLKYLFKIVYYLNKKIAKDIIQIETKEESDKRQEKFKIKDGSEVKLKSDLIKGKYYGEKEFTGNKAKNLGKILIVRHHRNSHDDQMRCNDKKTGERCVGIYTDEMLEVIKPKVKR